MKTNITLCLDHELVHRLREGGNMSQVINALLEKHLFGTNTKEGMQKLILEKTEEKAQIDEDIITLKHKLKERPKLVVRYT